MTKHHWLKAYYGLQSTLQEIQSSVTDEASVYIDTFFSICTVYHISYLGNKLRVTAMTGLISSTQSLLWHFPVLQFCSGLNAKQPQQQVIMETNVYAPYLPKLSLSVKDLNCQTWLKMKIHYLNRFTFPPTLSPRRA